MADVQDDTDHTRKQQRAQGRNRQREAAYPAPADPCVYPGPQQQQNCALTEYIRRRDRTTIGVMPAYLASVQCGQGHALTFEHCLATQHVTRAPTPASQHQQQQQQQHATALHVEKRNSSIMLRYITLRYDTLTPYSMQQNAPKRGS